MTTTTTPIDQLEAAARVAASGMHRSEEAMLELLRDVGQAAGPDGLDPYLQRELRALITVTAAAAGAHRLEEVLELAAEEALAATGASSLSISRWERESGALQTLLNVGDLGPGEERWPENELYPMAEYPLVMGLLRHGEPYVTNIHDRGADSAAVQLLRDLGKEAHAGVPILYEGVMWGELWATSAPGERRLGPREARLLQAIAGQIATAIGRAELFSRMQRMAYEDPLTGLANRRALDERLDETLADTGVRGTVLSLVICDVDDFKGVNDTLGHEAGDRVLRRVADALSAAASRYPGALAARSGGDEFCVVLPRQGSHMAERLAREAGSLVRGHTDPAVTLSWGVADTSAGARRPADLFQAADAAQYAAKRRGHGQLCVARRGDEPLAAGTAGPRRLRRDRSETYHGIVGHVVERMDALPASATTVDRLEQVAVALTGSLDAAAWSISFVGSGADMVTTQRRVDGRLDQASGIRSVYVATEDRYRLNDFPLTAGLIERRGGVVLRVEDGLGQSGEERLLTRLGYDAVLGAAAANDEGAWLLAIFSDARTFPLAPALDLARLLVSHGVQSRREPAG